MTVPLASPLAVATPGEEGGFWANAFPIIPHPAELIVGIIAFAILYFVVKTRVVPRFEEAYRQRTEAIEGGLERAERAQREAEALLAQYRQQLQEARGEAARIRTDAQSERKAIVDAARTEAQEEAQRVGERSRAQLQADLAQARAELSRDVGRIAVDLASRIVGENLADTDRTRRTVDAFLGDLQATDLRDGAAASRPAVGAGVGGPDGAGRAAGTAGVR